MNSYNKNQILNLNKKKLALKAEENLSFSIINDGVIGIINENFGEFDL
jgi:hypothetical protein